MIKFFRIIRQQLLTENKFSKYLLYAIGEIVLVVIGILIALGVNNLNEEAKEHKLGKDYLSRIHRDLVQDTISFRSIIITNNKLREDIKGLLITLYGEVDNIEQVQDMSEVYDKAMDQVFSPNNNTYNSIISSGTLGFIQNLELKEKIVDLYSEYDQKEALLVGIGGWMLNLATAESAQTDFIKFNKDVFDIFTTHDMLNKKDFAFLNNKEGTGFKMIVRAISATAFNQKTSNRYYIELINKCDTVLKLIELELE